MKLKLIDGNQRTQEPEALTRHKFVMLQVLAVELHRQLQSERKTVRLILETH